MLFDYYIIHVIFEYLCLCYKFVCWSSRCKIKENTDKEIDGLISITNIILEITNDIIISMYNKSATTLTKTNQNWMETWSE
jgi:hypothetical protein